ERDAAEVDDLAARRVGVERAAATRLDQLGVQAQPFSCRGSGSEPARVATRRVAGGPGGPPECEAFLGGCSGSEPEPLQEWSSATSSSKCSSSSSRLSVRNLRLP